MQTHSSMFWWWAGLSTMRTTQRQRPSGKYSQLDSVSSIVRADQSRKGDTSVPAILNSMGRTRDGIAFKDATLDITVMVQRMEWDTKEEGQAAKPPRHTLFLKWRRQTPDGDKGKDEEPQPLPTDKTAIRVVCTLDVEKLREEGGPKFKPARWAEEKCWQLTSPKIQPPLTTPAPMIVGKRAKKLKVMPYTFVRQILTSSGSTTGVEYRLFMSKAMAKIKDLEARMAWVKLPSEPQCSITELW